MCRCCIFTTLWIWCLLVGKRSWGKQWSGWETEAGRGGIWNSILSPVSDMEELMYGAVMDVERKGLC